jgi:hypothetical protein
MALDRRHDRRRVEARQHHHRGAQGDGRHGDRSGGLRQGGGGEGHGIFAGHRIDERLEHRAPASIEHPHAFGRVGGAADGNDGRQLLRIADRVAVVLHLAGAFGAQERFQRPMAVHGGIEAR